MPVTRSCTTGLAAMAVLLLGFSAAFAGEEPSSPSVVSLAIDATVSPEGRVLLRAEIRLGENALEEVDSTAFEINRTSHTGDSLWFPVPVDVEGGVEAGAVSLDWTDSAVERGSAYRYYLEYFSSDVCLASNVVSIYVPEMAPEGETTGPAPAPQRPVAARCRRRARTPDPVSPALFSIDSSFCQGPQPVRTLNPPCRQPIRPPSR